jgi:hypothetical protein
MAYKLGLTGAFHHPYRRAGRHLPCPQTRRWRIQPRATIVTTSMYSLH